MITRRKLVIGTMGGTALAMALPHTVMAAKPKVYSNSSTGIAINGYDPVAYFSQSKPVEGSKQFSAKWQGATWYFSNEENKSKFQAAPKKYAPQYGGYCAFAVSYGSTATTVPEAWSIVGGKLYLNNSLGVRERWKTDIPGYIKKANANWPAVLK